MAGAEEICDSLADRQFRSIGLVLNQRGLERALQCDLDEVNVVAYAADGYALANTGRSAAECNTEAQEIVGQAQSAGIPTTATISVAFGDPRGAVDVSGVAEVAAQLADAGASEVALGDTIGTAVPSLVKETIAEVRDAVGVPLRCHFHNTRNMGYANVFSAIAAGVNAIDTSVGGYGGSPFSPNSAGNVATEDVVWALHRSGYETGMNLDALVETSSWLSLIFGQRQPPSMVSRSPQWPPNDLPR